jgi:hypothetical protein
MMLRTPPPVLAFTRNQDTTNAGCAENLMEAKAETKFPTEK